VLEKRLEEIRNMRTEFIKTGEDSTGVFRAFKRESILVREYEIVKGKKHGYYRSYYTTTGNIWTESKYQFGFRVDTVKNFYENGNLKMLAPISDGEKTRHTFFHENGVVSQEVGLKSGLNHGYYKRYDSLGNLNREGLMNMGERVGIWKFYKDTGLEEVDYDIKDRITIKKFIIDGELRFKYPSNWMVMPDNFKEEIVFTASPMREGTANQVIMMMKMPLPDEHKNLDQTINKNIEAQKRFNQQTRFYQNFRITQKNEFKLESYEGIDMFFEYDRQVGEVRVIPQKSYSRYFLKDNSLYEIKYSSRLEMYDESVAVMERICSTLQFEQ